MTHRTLDRNRYAIMAAAAAWVCVTIFVLSTGPAWATRGHVFEKSFGAKGSNPGQLEEPSGVAVNEATGDVYVVDKGNNRVEVFSANGTFEGQFNGTGTYEATVAGKLEKETGTPAPPSPLESPEGIAVDNSCSLHKPEVLTESTVPSCKDSDPSAGDVYVADVRHNVIDKFTSAGEYLGQVTEAEGSAFNRPEGVAVDSKGELWVYPEGEQVDNFTDALANEFIASRRLNVPGGFAESGVFAVDSKDDAYAEDFFEGVKSIAKFNSEGALLNGAIGDERFSENASGGVAVELSSGDVYIDQFHTVARFGPESSLIERLGAGQLTRGSGVGVSSASETVYVADAEADVVDIFSPEEPSKPTVTGESVSDITASSVTFEAEVNPRSKGGEKATEYHLQYGPCNSPSTCSASSFEASTPNASLPPDFEVHAVGPLNVQGLSPSTVYHFRVVATNSHGTTEGERNGTAEEVGHTFTTQAVGAFLLPDSRAWELVSPPDKQGAAIEVIGQGHVTQASAEGGAVSYATNLPTESEPPGYSTLVQVLSTRGPQGWASRDISPPHVAATGHGFEGEYALFSSDLSLGVVQPFGAFIPSSSPFALAPREASEQTAFLHTEFPSGDTGDTCPTPAQEANGISCYRPLVTAHEGFANVPPGTVFGEPNTCPFGDGGGGGALNICGPKFVGATPDLSHVVLESTVALTRTSLPAGEDGLYEWSAGHPPGEQLKLVSVLPKVLPGETETAASNAPELGYHNAVARNAISDDGARVVWTEKQGKARLFLRDVARAETVQLDAVQGGSGEHGVEEGGRGPTFQSASSDGSRVFFTDTQRLTADSGGGPGENEADLYECAIVVKAGALSCDLTDLTPLRSGEGVQVLDELLGTSEDGSYVYFVSNGVLTEGEGAVNGKCRALSSLSGALCNLYVAHYNGSVWETRLAAVLSANDFPDWNGDGGENFLAEMTSRVSPDGHWLAFMSERGLTGYDTRDAVTGKPDEEVYLYSAISGRTACASCNPSGARPMGVNFDNMLPGADGELKVWGGQGVAGTVPTWSEYGGSLGAAARYQSRYLSDSGRLFFNSNDALVSLDANRTGDVYEYEPEGVGSQDAPCGPSAGTGSDVFKPAHPVEMEGAKKEEPGGCVGLISSGSSPEESVFLDASESGSDVFFLTTRKLAPQDFDTTYDVYDAHECTTESPCPTASVSQPPECTTEASCKAAASPQPSIFGAPASTTFTGSSNVASAVSKVPMKPRAKSLTRAQKLYKALHTCRKDKSKKRRAACEKRARKKYGTKPKPKAKSYKGAK
jgi:DNA-binding beta-propeller fold protein YncE